MKRIKFTSIIALFTLCFLGSNAYAEKLDKLIVVNLGAWNYQQANPNYGNNQCFWNTLTSIGLGAETYEATYESQTTLLDMDLKPTSISLTVSSSFGGIVQSSNAETDVFTSGNFSFDELPGFEFHRGVLNNSFTGGMDTYEEGELLLSGFDPDDKCNIYIFCRGSKGSTDGKNRETLVTATGTNVVSGAQDSYKNVSKLISLKDVQPTAEGKIALRVKGGPNNATQYKEFYINSLFIEPASTSGISSAQEDEISIYPNPFAETITIANVEDLKTVNISDLSGKVVFSKSFSSDAESCINLGFLNSGIYFLQSVDINGSVQTTKLIKK
ncbi:T9SS type A sorting domain-containing protein [Dysgonomonas sp. 520]|uniref:T9SS type A sorting domain-containing protein n=1 Tax=Dysgonomonas sp. 520 TaxID=2302931 RepID=UPI0013D75047|nr:T9SS type A sorting domain-containing protein [Dysgonomonas sp. 520]NDW08565.1 T9SS C-terminal target domain-containing protein [Dysgonomonas sp. 520]